MKSWILFSHDPIFKMAAINRKWLPISSSYHAIELKLGIWGFWLIPILMRSSIMMSHDPISKMAAIYGKLLLINSSYHAIELELGTCTHFPIWSHLNIYNYVVTKWHKILSHGSWLIEANDAKLIINPSKTKVVQLKFVWLTNEN